MENNQGNQEQHFEEAEISPDKFLHTRNPQNFLGTDGITKLIGIVQGFQPVLAYNYGAKLYDRVKQVYKVSLSLSSLFSIVAFLLCMIFPRQISSLFGTGNKAFFTFTVRFLRIYMLLTFANGIQPIVYNIFNSIGKVKIGMIVTLSRQILFAIPLLILLPALFGLEGALWATPIADFLAAILSFALFAREIKKQTNLS